MSYELWVMNYELWVMNYEWWIKKAKRKKEKNLWLTLIKAWWTLMADGKNKKMAFKFEKLRIREESVKFANEIYAVTKTFPKAEQCCMHSEII